ncbi:hypothetical protein ACFL21_04515 [Patescibacteria group bacterium]
MNSLEEKEDDLIFPYPDEADKERMANPTYDPTKIIIGETVSRLFQATGIPLHTGKLTVLQISDTEIICRGGYENNRMTFNKTTGISINGIKSGRLETE